MDTLSRTTISGIRARLVARTARQGWPSWRVSRPGSVINVVPADMEADEAGDNTLRPRLPVYQHGLGFIPETVQS